MVVNGYSTVKASEVVAIDNKDDVIVFLHQGYCSSRIVPQGQTVSEEFTSPYSGACARLFEIVIVMCGHLDSGLCCTTVRDHTVLLSV
jgi:hypothetical protein